MARALVDMKVFKPKPLNTRVLKGQVESALRSTQKDVTRYIGWIVDTWEHTVPIQNEPIKYVGQDAIARTIVRDAIFAYLDGGTEERWAVMNTPFQAKTSPKQLRSGPGVRTYNKYGYYTATRGRARMRQPQPGIEARLFSQTIADKIQPELFERVRKAIEIAVRAL